MPYTVLLDVDCVLNNFMERTLQVFSEQTGRTILISTFTEYGIEKCISAEDVKIIHRIWRTKELWDSLRPPDGAQDAVKSMLQNGLEVYVMSNCSHDTIGWKLDWIEKYYPLISTKNIAFGYPKHKFNCDFVVEDKLETLLEFPQWTYKICIDNPWNSRGKDYDEVHAIHRVKDVDEVWDVIYKLIEGENEY